MLVPVLLFLAQTIPPDALPHINAGMEAQQQGRLTDAIAEFKTVTELAPALPAAFVGLGDAYLRSGDYQAAIAPLQHALELNPDLPGAHQMLGYSLLSAGYAAEAIPHLEKVQALDALGIAQLKTGRLPEAIANLRQALANNPDNPDLLYYLGRATGLLSRQTFETLHAAHPDSARAHQVLAETYAVLRNVPGAEKEYREAIHLKPDIPGLHLELGELYAADNRWENAAGEFLAESRLQPGDAEAAFRLGNALLQQGKVKEARPALNRAKRLNPDMPETLYALGKAASLDGDKVEAGKAWRRVIEMEKESPLAGQAHFALATLYRQQGDTAKADAELKEFQRLRQARTLPPK